MYGFRKWLTALLALCLLATLPTALAEDLDIEVEVEMVEAEVVDQELLLGEDGGLDLGYVDFVTDVDGIRTSAASAGEIVDGVLYVAPGTTKIERYKYLNDRRFTSAIIPEGVTEIGTSAFEGCSNLETVSLPSTLTTIWSSAFSGCSKLKQIVLPEGVTQVSINAFDSCTSLESASLPSTLTTLENIFDDCTSLKEVVLSEGLTTIEGTPFSGCTALERLVLPASLNEVEIDAFKDCPGLAEIVFAEGTTVIGEHWCHNAVFLKRVVLPEGVRSIGDSAFYGCTGLAKVVLPQSLTSIDDYAFNKCTSLSAITIPDGVVSIGSYAFDGCSGMTAFTLPTGVQEIGEGAFYNCTALTSVTLPDTLKTISNSLFEGCSALTKVVVPKSVTSVGWNAFMGCPKLTVYGDGGSFIDEWTEQNNVPFVALTPATPKTIALNKTGLVDLNIKKTLKLRATLTPRNANKTVAWTSSDPKIAKVDGNGMVKPVKAGTVTITATTVNNLKVTVKVRVIDPKAKVMEIAFPKGGRISKGSKLTLYTGENMALAEALSITPYGAKPSMTWSTSNKSVLTVDKKGKIKAQKPGKATITVKAKGGKTAKLEVTVKQNKVDNINKKPSTRDIEYGDYIWLKSIEIVSPSKVKVEYWILYKHLSNMYCDKIDYLDAYASVNGERIFDGKVEDIPCKVQSNNIRSFTVTFKGSQVKNTNVILKKNKSNIKDWWEYVLTEYYT